FNEREFIPKIYEPAPFSRTVTRATAEQWHADGRYCAALVDALGDQGFKNIRVDLDGSIMRLVLTNTRISNMGRAVGRAARTALAFAPPETRSIHVTYTKL